MHFYIYTRNSLTRFMQCNTSSSNNPIHRQRTHPAPQCIHTERRYIIKLLSILINSSPVYISLIYASVRAIFLSVGATMISSIFSSLNLRSSSSETESWIFMKMTGAAMTSEAPRQAHVAAKMVSNGLPRPSRRQKMAAPADWIPL